MSLGLQSTRALRSDIRWSEIDRLLCGPPPWNYAVVDGFLSDEAFSSIREYLVTGAGWRHKNWSSNHLHWDLPKHPAVAEVGVEIERNLPVTMSDRTLITSWALMYNRNVPGRMHADLCDLNVTLWLTPDEHNLDPASGGLELYPIRRLPDDSPDRFVGKDAAEGLVEERVLGQHANDLRRVAYRANRAVIFDGRMYHRTEAMQFRCDSARTSRINLALSFDSLRRMRAIYADGDAT